METLDDSDWRRLVYTIQRGKCILFLGPDAAVDDPDCIPLAQRLRRSLAATPEAGPATPDRDDLPSVAQTFEAARGRVELEMEVEDFCRDYAGRTSQLHRHLAALPFPVYINTAPDPALVNALRAAGRNPRCEYYDFKRTRGFDLPVPTPDRPWVYDLYGSLEDTPSLVLSERDLLDYLVKVVKGAPPLPAALISRIRDPDTSLLFVCFGFRHWYLRILLQVLRSYDPPNNPSLALEDGAFYSHPERPQTLVFFDRAHRIRFRQAVCGDFAAELHRRCQGGERPTPPPQPQPPAEAPMVFISYASEDYAAVEELRQGLQAGGVRVWLDRQNLRGGDRWELLIQDVIGKQADYVLVVQTRQLQARVESYVHAEVAQALTRQKKFPPPLRFLIPARLESGVQLAVLSGLQSVDLAAGLDNLLAAIREDWQRRGALQGAAR